MQNNFLSKAAVNAALIIWQKRPYAVAIRAPIVGLTKRDVETAGKILEAYPDFERIYRVFTLSEYLLEKGWLPASAAYNVPPDRPSVSITGAPTEPVNRAAMDRMRRELAATGQSQHSGAAETVWAATIICRALAWPYEVIVIRDECFKAVAVHVQRTDVPKLPAALKEGWTASVAETFQPDTITGA